MIKMLEQWKLILKNWINCYTPEDNEDQQKLNLESLICIISHLRENLNLDESKSSILEANTVQEFLCEKYPEFKFENGTADAQSEEEIFLAASLLLYFVCVNSKNFAFKNVMCNKLRADDQEIILKFSKSLMGYAVITKSEVQSAITEACGQHTAATEAPHNFTVPETPPALRSLHSEMRRLQAALDAERFDRNYLQEELTRTNGKLERLLKEKEQHKLEIVNLKAKISLCCGEEANVKNADEAADRTAKLSRQLQQLEQKLEEAQMQLNDVVYERDSYKAKIDEIKHDRDKWLTLSQQETTRVAQLIDELEAEKRQSQSLRELVSEIRQHNKRNGFDTSSLECDDLDASIHSLQHNSSVCSELCANVVEVQLGEERAKIVDLKQQIQLLQDQINEINQKSEVEKKSLETIISQRENDIFNLKHRINEEIEEKNNLKLHCDAETTKLNNELNELEQKYKDHIEYSSSMTEKKMQEIQTLQEEKLSLIHSLNNETTKLENIVKGLQSELESEKQSRLKMKEGYENHIMKLNEKVLNRNNELVELQNSVFEKGELIEKLQIELRNGKELMDKLKQDYHNLHTQRQALESDLKRKCDELQNLYIKLQHSNTIIDDIKSEIEQLKTSNSEQSDNIKILESAKAQLLNELKNRDNKIEEIMNDIHHMNEVLNKEKNKLLQDIDEKNATISFLQTQLQNEITFKVGLQNELIQEQAEKASFYDKYEKSNNELSKLRAEIKDKERVINSMDLLIKEEKELNDKAKRKIQDMTHELNQKNDNMRALNDKLETVSNALQDEIQNSKENVEVYENKLLSEITEKETLNLELKTLLNEKTLVENELSMKCEEMLTLQNNYKVMLQEINECRSDVKTSKEKLEQERESKSTVILQKEADIKELKTKLAELQLVCDKLNEDFTKEREMYAQSIQSLQKENEQLHFTIEEENRKHEVILKDKDQIIDKLEQQLKENIVKFEDLSHYTEELKISWDDYKAESKSALQQKEDKIARLNEMALNLEQKINEVEQEKGELTKRIAEIEENKTLDMQNLASEEKALRDVLESEKENIVSEKRFLLRERENILADKAVLIKELDEERAYKKMAEEEINILRSVNVDMKQLLNVETERTKMLLHEKECVTQQLIEEKSVKEITEKEKENIVAEKQKLEEKITENEKIKTLLYQKVQTLKTQLEVLNLNINKESSIIINLKEENTKLTEELTRIQCLDNEMQEEIRRLAAENDRLRIKLHKVTSIKETLEAEKVDLEMALQKENVSRKEVETEKNNVAANLQLELINKDEENKTLIYKNEALVKHYEEIKTAQETLIKEKDIIIQEMKTALCSVEMEKESLLKTLNNDRILNEQLQSEMKAFITKLEIDLINTRKEMEKLQEELKNLNVVLAEEKAARDSLENERDLADSEKNFLIASLNDEKSVRDALENEKKYLENKLNIVHELNKEYETSLRDKESEMEQLNTQVQHLIDTQVKTKESLHNGLKKITETLKECCNGNNTLQKLITENSIEDMKVPEACSFVISVADVMAPDVLHKEKLELLLKNENDALSQVKEMLKERDAQVFELQTEIRRLKQVVNESRTEHTKQSESYASSINSKINDIHLLQHENQALHNDLNDVKVQLEVKVHSLKEKLVENENLTDKLKRTYECQIDNLNLMVTKLSNYLKEKTSEIEALRKEKEQLQQTVEDCCKVIKTLEDEVKTEKHNMDKLISDFESERQVLKNMVIVTESVMEDQKISLSNTITEHSKTIEKLEAEISRYKKSLSDLEMSQRSEEIANKSLLTLLRLERKGKEDVEKESEYVREYLDEVISYLSKERNTNISVISALEFQEKVLVGDYEKMKNDLEVIKKDNEELKKTNGNLEQDLQAQRDMLQKVLQEKAEIESSLEEIESNCTGFELEIKELTNKLQDLIKEKNELEHEKNTLVSKIEENNTQFNAVATKNIEEVTQLKSDKHLLENLVEENKNVIANLEQLVKNGLEQNNRLRDENIQEKLVMTNRCTQLEDSRSKIEIELEERQKDVVTLRNEVEILKSKIEQYDSEVKSKDVLISKMSKEKDAIISTISKELVDEKAMREKYEKELETQKSIVNELKNNLEIQALRTENEQLIRAIGQKETFTALCQEKATDKYSGQMELRDHHQVDSTTSDLTHSSNESLKTITDLEKIIHDKNRTITTLQTDIKYLKSIMADSETKLLDVTRELDVTKENCQQLSNQLKKIVYQKNEEIADLKKQVNKMSATENGAKQFIKVSAKYQAMILKRMAEIKSDTVLKELTNFGNGNCDNEVRRSLAGSVTMEELENFLETTDRHMKRCTEKQISLQKERDRLSEVNRINESEIINLRKFLTELSVRFQTFSSLKEMYGQKLSRVISVQRTVRREILSLDGRITDAAMCKLERGYGAAMQDLSECTMNLERWVERCISRTVSVEKIKQAFTSDSERLSLSSPTFQNTGLEIQLEELEKLFQKLLEEVARAIKGDGAKNEQATTVMEIRAEYEDKLNRMKAKMKELFNEQMAVLKNKQREEIALLERELQKTRDRMEDSKRSYEAHIRDLTKELWTMSEKFLVKNDEAEWLKKKQKSGSLMSLQHVHSSGLVPLQEPPSRPSDAHSLRSLPTHDNNAKPKREGRGMHMSDEEGEVFDNRYLKELATPSRPSGHRLSELKWRNSLCPPHLKSSYPAETQFTAVLDEDELKTGTLGHLGARSQRKEVGITAYKKPGPPTPSKQAGRLSATDSELRESLRVEAEPSERKTSTPARFRAFLRFNKNDTNEGTPRARRLSNIFRKKQ